MSSLRRYPLPVVWTLACAAFILVILVNGIIAYQALSELTRNQRDVASTLSTIVGIKSAYAALLDAEAGQRGYLLTGETKYFEPFERGLTTADDHMQELMAGAVHSPDHAVLVSQLQSAIEDKVVELRDVLGRLQNNELARVPMGLLSSQGKRKMDVVRGLVDKLEQEQYNLLTQRQLDARKSRRSAYFALIISSGGSLLLVVLIYFLVRRSSNTRERLTLDLQQVNDHLEAKVNERTAALTHYANELQRSNRELQDFAFVASHDLQEPLRKIRAFGNRLQQKYADALEEQGADYIHRMQGAAERMSRLINDLLTFSRVATKGKPFEAVDLNKTVATVLDDLEVAIEEADAHIEVDTLPTIEADPTQMRQLMQNLIGNAIKFRDPDKTPRVQVTCNMETDVEINEATVGDVCEIAVVDNGIGFEEQFIDRIFTPFQRLHGRDQYEGTGIGLAVCRRIIERHEGMITAESVPGEGAKFVLRLPMKQSIKTLHEIYDDDAKQS
jgi:signal transduction histidine kinase